MSAPGDPLTGPKACEEQLLSYPPEGFTQPANLPYQQQPQTYSGPDLKGAVQYVDQIPGVPPGLEYLVQVNQLSVYTKYFTTQSGKTYEIKNSIGQQIFVGHSDQKCCGPLYDVMLRDNSNTDVIQLLEICKCTCRREVEIYSPPGTIIGYATLSWYTHVTSLSILNASKETVLLIVGPSFRTLIFGDVNFEVRSKDETQTIGQIVKDNNQFSVQFPLDLEVKMKVVLLGATLYLDHLVEMKRRQLEREARQRN
uniref:Phospholipid scramblase n=1 Tax=Geotrypetes seraphini TaxID=260995 RepID=A0A6P8PF41_GEOSA|nr:phospholipid scramblase 2-like [Geotrypetes seraphini]XP_033779770.1 phospholipid scramblase 2-like [Geotrypetes seraphini]